MLEPRYASQADQKGIKWVDRALVEGGLFFFFTTQTYLPFCTPISSLHSHRIASPVTSHQEQVYIQPLIFFRYAFPSTALAASVRSHPPRAGPVKLHDQRQRNPQGPAPSLPTSILLPIRPGVRCQPSSASGTLRNCWYPDTDPDTDADTITITTAKLSPNWLAL